MVSDQYGVQVSDDRYLSSTYLKADEVSWYKDKMKNEEKRRWFFLLILGIFIFLISISAVYGVYLVSQTTSLRSKAYETYSRKLQLSNSYLFASPLRAKAGGERIRVTVFLLDSQGLGVSGKQVFLTKNGVQVEEVQGVTDDLGKAIFDVYSNSPGAYQLEAMVDGKVIPQKVLVTFE